jgi:drug/metabolite transporter (DMT)-like permease
VNRLSFSLAPSRTSRETSYLNMILRNHNSIAMTTYSLIHTRTITLSETYIKRIVPVAGLFALSLWASNTAYVHLSVAFIQMLKALMPVSVYTVGCVIGIEKYSRARFFNMIVVTLGVAIASYGELNFHTFGFCVQMVAILAETCRIVLVQIILGKAKLKLNSITTLYYVSPACFVFLFAPFALFELSPITNDLKLSRSAHHSATIMFANATCAFALNAAVYLLIGKTSALTMNIAGVVKDFFLIWLSAVIFESPISSLQIVGFSLAVGGVFYYNYSKYNEELNMPDKDQARANDAILKSPAS